MPADPDQIRAVADVMAKSHGAQEARSLLVRRERDDAAAGRGDVARLWRAAREDIERRAAA